MLPTKGTMMIGRRSKGHHHIAGEDEHRTNDQPNERASSRWEKKALVLALMSVVLVRTRERFVYICGGKRETGFERYFPWGKEGDYKEISSTLDDDGRAGASRHVTTRTPPPRAAFFLYSLYSLSFLFFSIRLHFCISSFGRVSITSVSRDTLLRGT